MSKPTLLVLAAGMGSRYGGLKQIDAMGPGGEAMIDFSVFDALRAGFGKVVVVIRRDFEDQFRAFADDQIQLKILKRCNFRQTPELRGRIIEILEPGTMIVGLAHKENWLRLHTEEGHAGWVHQSLAGIR